MDKLQIFRNKKCKNPEISLWKEQERQKRKLTGKATRMVYTPKKIILCFN